MKAGVELDWLQKKLESGDMSPEEPLFILRARDVLASHTVRRWVEQARLIGDCVPGVKIAEAERLADQMDAWPIKQVPGRPDTRVDSSDE